jgi:fructosamine-3-kinase
VDGPPAGRHPHGARKFQVLLSHHNPALAEYSIVHSYSDRLAVSTMRHPSLSYIAKILRACNLEGAEVNPVSGGDINETFCLKNQGKKFFLKVNDATRFPRMFQCEAAGLWALKENASLTIPKVIQQGEVDGKQFLLLEWLEPGMPSKKFWENFGAALATLHKQPQPSFGWQADNYIGGLLQRNNPHSAWPEFYFQCRIMPLTEQLIERNQWNHSDKERVEKLADHLKKIFPDEPPALLHGDLWSGNFMITASGEAAVFDPAVYCGHREMDLGMTLLFGGFDPRFYHSYQEVYPLQADWKQRVKLTQLYPLLVHAVLFGGHYIESARNNLRMFA